MASSNLNRLAWRVFSGIQPTGVPHLGNYFGAISKWIQIANERTVIHQDKQIRCDEPIYCIVDVHAYSSPNVRIGSQLYNNILSTTAALLALGLDPAKCILFRQSDLLEHFYLDNVLDNFISPNRLTRMIQFREKSASNKSVPNSLLNYPILQAADILLYRADLVPVGEDQIQHIELSREIAKRYNRITGSEYFTLPEPLLDHEKFGRRIKSLRNPVKKMSKSDADMKSFIQVIDDPDIIIEKCKKSITDCISEVYYDAEKRPGVSNLMRIYQLTTGMSIVDIEKKFSGFETAKFKLSLADILIERFARARATYEELITDRNYLEKILKSGADRARPIATETVYNVRHHIGSYRYE